MSPAPVFGVEAVGLVSAISGWSYRSCPRRETLAPRTSIRCAAASGGAFPGSGARSGIQRGLAGGLAVALARALVVGLAEQTLQHVLHDRALAGHAFDRLADRQRLGEGIEERAFAADDVDVGLAERGGQHVGLFLRHFLVGVDAGDGLLEVLLQLHAELFMRTRLVAERIARAELLRQALGFGTELRERP